MCLWSNFEKVLGVYGQSTWDRGKSRENLSNTRDGISTNTKVDTELEWKNCNLKPLRKKGNKQVPPILQSSKEKGNFKWKEECEHGFRLLKQYLSLAPFLSNLVPREDFFVYQAVSNTTISSVLIKEVEGHQRLVNYISKEMVGTKMKYSGRKVRPNSGNCCPKGISYFQAHKVIVLTNFPLRQTLEQPEASRQLMKWAIGVS